MPNRDPAPGEVFKAFRLAEGWPDEYSPRNAGLKAALRWVMSEEPEASKPASDSHRFFPGLPKRPRPPDMSLIVTAWKKVDEPLASTLAAADTEHWQYYEAVQECLAWIVRKGSRPVELG